MSTRSQPSAPDLASLARGIRGGERAVIARAITLIESRRADHQKAARRLVQELLPSTGKAVRVGITGVPGVGKSTTIDALGTFLTASGHRVAVLAVDPSSARAAARSWPTRRAWRGSPAMPTPSCGPPRRPGRSAAWRRRRGS